MNVSLCNLYVMYVRTYICTSSLVIYVYVFIRACHNREHEIRAEKCSDTCYCKMKFVLTFTKNNLTLVL